MLYFLVSSDFLASDYCYEKEAARALQRHEQRSARVIPGILRPCEWHRTPFAALLATPTDVKPITNRLLKKSATRNRFPSLRPAALSLGSLGAEGMCVCHAVSQCQAASSRGSPARLLATMVRMKRARTRLMPR